MRKAATFKVLEYELPIKIEGDKTGGFVATTHGWSDCYAQGDSIDEVVNEITAVAASLIELYKEEGFKIPLKSTLFDKSTFRIPVLTSA
ncbi:hypothetical protein A3D07_00955 [Candidatus Curtissbacteria bacterium RIFCSPHIGHO2_02_FULL_42_15]|uniref:HicB-like antitoxin of toxin-antitoxin system domain-containing protein n=1 Tax=Candidatus Curtissbacteria bacterium RIFCSPHIGHO2_02_FULL_42_15 TaxID=1797716 RepID=A0A1F5GCR3_9BACT|nr:MAG: hypothetical protein A3D07_00955 [Candidatus Curtissbacteria bacterium RIFCSPHIGHO2_02_FULL_42_15]